MKTHVLPWTLPLALFFSLPAPAGEMDMVEIEVLFLKAGEKQWAEGLGGLPHIDIKQQPNVPGPFLMVNGVFTAGQISPLVQKMKDAGAEVITHQKLITVSGHELTVRNVRELRYPTAFSEAKDGSAGVYPTAFDTKDVGLKLALTPKVGPDGATIDLAFAPRIVDFRGFIDAGQIKPDTDTRDPATIKKLLQAPLKKGSPWQPIFDTRELSTSVTLHDGNTLLLNETPNPDEPGSGLTGILVTVRLAPRK